MKHTSRFALAAVTAAVLAMNAATAAELTGTLKRFRKPARSRSAIVKALCRFPT